MGKSKFYVVWKGRRPGIYDTWKDCQAQVEGFPNQVYKSFTTRQLAEQAFRSESREFIGKEFFEPALSSEQLKLIGDPIRDSISVDAAWNTKTGVVEYRGVSTKTGNEIFYRGPFEDGTKYLNEKLVHGERIQLTLEENSCNVAPTLMEKSRPKRLF